MNLVFSGFVWLAVWEILRVGSCSMPLCRQASDALDAEMKNPSMWINGQDMTDNWVRTPGWGSHTCPPAALVARVVVSTACAKG